MAGPTYDEPGIVYDDAIQYDQAGVAARVTQLVQQVAIRGDADARVTQLVRQVAIAVTPTTTVKAQVIAWLD